MSWPIGFSWTKTHMETTTNPDGSKEEMKVQGGPFLNYYFWGWRFYFGMRPTAPWSRGFGNEGDLGTGFFGRWMKKIGWGNFGAALRPEKRK
jgi:hypothetical protein